MSSDYPADWDQRRRDVYERDRYTCQNCGRDGGKGGSAELHAHHIVPKSAGGSHNKSNLKTVCAECHRAIHGDSVAPSARSNSPGGEEHQITIEVDQFPYAAGSFVELGRELETVADELSTIDDALDKLLDMLDMAVSLGKQERPPRFEEHYTSRLQKLETTIQYIEITLEEITTTPPDFKEKTSIERFDRLSENATKMVALLREYKTIVKSIVKSSHDVSSESNLNSDFAELQLVNSELQDSVENFVEAAEAMIEAIGNEISHVIENLKQDSNESLSLNHFNQCPICGAAESKMQTSDDLDIIRCTACRTELQSSSWLQWEMIHGIEQLNGLSMSIEMWQSYDIKDIDDDKFIEELQEAGDKSVQTIKLLIVILLLFQLFGGIMWYISGSVSYSLLLVLLPFLLAIIGIKIVHTIWWP